MGAGVGLRRLLFMPCLFYFCSCVLVAFAKHIISSCDVVVIGINLCCLKKRVIFNFCCFWGSYWYFLEIIGVDRRYFGKISTFCVVLCFLDLYFEKKNLENMDDIDMRKKKRKNDEKQKKLDADGSLLNTMDMQSNG